MPQVMNPDYTVVIGCPDRNIYVMAPMPETFMYDSSANYEAPFSSGLSGKIANAARFIGIKGVTQAMTMKLWQGSSDIELGLEIDFQAETDANEEVRKPILDLLSLTTPSTLGQRGFMLAPGPQIGQTLWDSISADRDKADVAVAQSVNSNVNIGTMSNPSQEVVNGSNNTVTNSQQSANGDPSFGSVDWAMSKVSNQIYINIGRYIYFKSVVITNVQQTYTNLIDANTGLAQHARVSIRFSPLFMVVAEDLPQIFQLPGR